MYSDSSRPDSMVRSSVFCLFNVGSNQLNRHCRDRSPNLAYLRISCLHLLMQAQYEVSVPNSSELEYFYYHYYHLALTQIVSKSPISDIIIVLFPNY